MTTHTYATSLTWAGSTGAGYPAYDRGHEVRPAGAPALSLSADAAFLGDPGRANPEVLLLAAASSCQLLSFLAVAARARVDVVGYADDATATMPMDQHPARITEMVLRPRIRVRDARRPAGTAGTTVAAVERLVRLAHEQCYIANSLSTSVRVEPSIVIEPSKVVD
jgi:organic hydroperoxide reductase OsmC/OhrA